MFKLSNVFLYGMVLFFLLISSHIYGQRRNYLPVEKYGQNQIIKGDTTVFKLDGYKAGTIQWYKSEEEENWSVIPGQTSDSLKRVPSVSTYYRAAIYDGTCDPCYSESFRVVVLEKEDVVVEIAEQVFPPTFSDRLKEAIESNLSADDYDNYISDLLDASKTLYDSIVTHYSIEEFRQAVDDFYQDFRDEQKSGLGCDIISHGMGYAKGLSIEMGTSITLAQFISSGLHAQEGGGLEIVYDFVNMTSQMYISTFCGVGVSSGLGIGAAFSGNTGFTGYFTFLFDIPYTSQVGPNLFSGSSRTMNYSLDLSFAAKLKLDLSVSYGKTQDVEYGCQGNANLNNCPDFIKAPLANGGVRGYTFGVSAGAGVSVGAKLVSVLAVTDIGTCNTGITQSFKDYSDNNASRKRVRAGYLMASELISPIPRNGFSAIKSPTDLVAAAAAIVYGYNSITECNNWTIPIVATKDVIEIAPTWAESGGLILHDGNNTIRRRGVIVSEFPDATFDDVPRISIWDSNDNSYDFSRQFPLPDSPDGVKTYYIRAFARNDVGWGYGQDVVFTPRHCPGTPTVRDADGNVYRTVLIGNQCWMAEDLRTTKYRNGENITLAGPPWGRTNGFYNNGYGFGIYSHGKRYDWYAVNSSKGLCPVGWSVPTDNQWKILEGTVDSQYGVGHSEWNKEGDRGYDAGINLTKDDWYSGGDPFGFSLSPNQIMTWSGSPTGGGMIIWSSLWTSTQVSEDEIWSRLIGGSMSSFFENGVSRNLRETNGMLGVRCIKN